MDRFSKVVSLLVLVLLVTSIFSLGCTKHPSAEQLQALEEQKQAALSAEKKLEDRRREKSQLESQLSQKRAELQKAKAELEAVKQRLGK